MAETELPQIYLISPPEIELSRFPDQLARVLDTTEIACVRLALATKDENHLARAADTIREVTHRRDVAVVIAEHVLLAERLGLDGVHLTDGARSIRKTRMDLGSDAIVGAFCAASRHDGMTAADLGCDYISFGPVGNMNLGDGTIAEYELFEWWSKMIEVPIVAEGALNEDTIALLTPVTDFFGIGEEIWRADDPGLTLCALRAAMK
ncbi:thiamine phosphate synthase [Pseudopelagicola sp. nBUS_19]|uniref:thiamine phosphate synthase n=1 Tax=Pseudopelagicola sp. nBUS_19 TaxID=3395316 RepID=UPI003EBB75AB